MLCLEQSHARASGVVKTGPREKITKGGAQGFVCAGTTWRVTPSHLNFGPLGLVLINKAVSLQVLRWGPPDLRGSQQTGKAPWLLSHRHAGGKPNLSPPLL